MCEAVSQLLGNQRSKYQNHTCHNHHNHNKNEIVLKKNS